MTSPGPLFGSFPHALGKSCFKTREEYLEIGLAHILTALHLLRNNPNYRFVLDQVACVKPFLERYPEAASEFKRFVREDRLQIVGVNDVVLHVNMPSGESWVRQVLYGKGYYQRELDVNVTVGWALDTFGHHAQMPQLLKLAGYKSYWFQRGVPGNGTPSDFLWPVIDGSQIPAFWLPLGYGLFDLCPRNRFHFSSYERAIWKALGHYSHWANRVTLAGADVINPEAILPVMVGEFDQKTSQPFTVRLGVPTDYESIVARRTNSPAISGELNPVFQGVYSNRIELNQRSRNLERILTTAEKLTALNVWLGISPDDRDLTGAWEPVLFNEAYHLISGDIVHRLAPAMTKLLVKSRRGNWEALGSQAANIVAEEQHGGDFWELYGTPNGGRLTAMTRKQAMPILDRSHFSNEWVGGNGAIESGPVFSEFHVSHPFGSGNFSTTVRLYPGVRRIDVETQLVNQDKFVRYRALFPTSIQVGRRFGEIPFGSIERATEQEFPVQNWIDWSDAGRGAALLNRGLPGNNVASGTLLLSLMRSARTTAYPFVGGYEPGTSSDLGLELGVQRTFDYALLPHSGDWRTARIYQAGLEFNNPLIVRVVSCHGGKLPKRWRLVKISPSNVVLSAFKPGAHGGAVIRVYEAGGQRVAGATMRFQPGALRASEVNLLEESIRDISLHADALTFDLAPYEIKTFKLDLR